MRTRVEERTAFSWSVKEPLLKETNGRCAHCGVPLDRYTNLTVDHVIPLDKGGSNDPENLTVLCEECNWQKSNMVLLPVTWYPYLCASKKQVLMDRIQTYMKETDYLAEDCLLPIDQFRIEVPVTTKKKLPRGQYKILRMPVYIRGSRISSEDAFDWLKEYARFLQYRDRMGTIKSPFEWRAPCYLLKKGEIDIAMVNPWMIHEWDEKIGNYRNEIRIDWYFSPDMPDRDYLPEMLSCMAAGLETYIAKSISCSMEGACVVLFRSRCMLSDKWCKPVFDRFSDRHNDVIVEYRTDYSQTARIRDLSAFHLLGDRDACAKLKKKLDEENPDGCIGMEEAMQENDRLNQRFKTERK